MMCDTLASAEPPSCSIRRRIPVVQKRSRVCRVRVDSMRTCHEDKEARPRQVRAAGNVSLASMPCAPLTRGDRMQLRVCARVHVRMHVCRCRAHLMRGEGGGLARMLAALLRDALR